MDCRREKFLTNLKEKDLYQLMKTRYSDLFDFNIENEYAMIDWYSSEVDIWFEAKCRKKHFPNLVIEKEKWDALIEKRQSYYVCSTPKGIYMAPIQEIEEPVWGENWMRKSTFFGPDIKITKESGFIRYESCIQIDHLLF